MNSNEIPAVINGLSTLYVRFRSLEKQFNKSRLNIFKKTKYMLFANELESLIEDTDKLDQWYTKLKKEQKISKTNKAIIKAINKHFVRLLLTMNSMHVYLVQADIGRNHAAPHKVLYLQNTQKLNNEVKLFIMQIKANF